MNIKVAFLLLLEMYFGDYGYGKAGRLFLCKCLDVDVLKCQQSEVKGAEILSYAEALDALTFEDVKSVFA